MEFFCSLKLPDLDLVGIWVGDGSSDVLASHNSEEVVQLGEPDTLSHDGSELKLLLEGKTDVLADILVIDSLQWVQLSHVVVDVLIDVVVLDDHDDLSLSSGLVEHIVDDVGTEHILGLVFECQVQKDALDLVVLVEFMLRFGELSCVIKSLKLILSEFSQINGLHALHGLVVASSLHALWFISSDRDHLTEDEELNILNKSHSFTEVLDDLLCVRGLDLASSVLAA